MPTKSILFAALCAMMAGCVTDGDAEGTPLTPHQAYVSFLARHQNDTVTIYAEDTLTIRGGKARHAWDYNHCRQFLQWA